MTELGDSPVSFVVDVRRLPQKGFPVRIEADAAQRALLANDHGLISVDRFVADLVVQTWKREGIRVSGTVDADVVQECIVTLEPLPAQIHETIEALFVPESSPLARPDHEDGEMFLSAEGPDAPETFDGESVDAGALAEEFFGLALDPYPRKAAAELPRKSENEIVSSPFVDLRGRLRKD